MARNNYTQDGYRSIAIQQMKDQREALANADKANNEPFHGKAGRKWYASEIADRGRMMSAQADMMETQSQMMKNNMLASEFDNIYAGAANDAKNRARTGRVTRAAMYKNALKNGGFVHPSIMPAVNQQLGSNGQIVGGTVDEHGNFITMGRDKRGKIVPIGITSAAEMVGDMVRDGGDMDVADSIVKNLEKRMTKSQIRDLTGYTPERSQSIRQQQAADKEAASTAKIKLDAVKTFAEIMKGTDGKQPPSRQEFLLSMLTNRDVIARMFPEKIDDKGNPVGLTEEDWTKAATIINGMYGDAKNEATGTGGWRDQAAGAIESVLGSLDGGQRGVDPVSYWRGRQQSEDAKAEYIRTHRKFQDYYDKDGKFHSEKFVTAITDENGVKRMYDTEGNEMEGAMTSKDYEAKLAADQERLDAEVKKAKSEEDAIRAEVEKTSTSNGGQSDSGDGESNGATGLSDSDKAAFRMKPASGASSVNGFKTVKQKESERLADDALAELTSDESGNGDVGVEVEFGDEDTAAYRLSKLTPEQDYGKKALEEFKRLHPDASDEDIASGKYRNQIVKIAQAVYGDKDFRPRGDELRMEAEKERRAKEAEDKRRNDEEADAERTLESEFKRDQEESEVKWRVEKMYGDLYKQASDYALEHHGEGIFGGDDVDTTRRKKFAELVKKYNKENKVQLDNPYHPEKNAFGDYHFADLLSSVFGEDEGMYAGQTGSRGRNQRRLSR